MSLVKIAVLKCLFSHALFCLCLTLFPVLACAQASQYLEMRPDTAYNIDQFIRYLLYVEDPDHSLSIDQCCDVNDIDWQPLTQNEIDFGFSTSKFWLKLPIINVGDIDGHWILDLNSRFMNGLEAFLVTSSKTELITEDSETRTFDQRQIPYRQIAGAFSPPPGEPAYLVIGYWSRGTTVLPFTLETQASFYQQWISENIIIVGFYSAMIFMMLFGLAQFLVLKRAVQLSYALYVAAGCLYVFHMDGLSFKFLWPNWPQWNADISLVLGLNIGVFSIIFARTFLRTSQVMPRVDRLLLAFLIAILTLIAMSFVVDMRHLKQYAFLVTTTAVFLCMASGFIAYARGQKDARFYVLGWIGLFLSTAFASVSHIVERVFPIPLTFDFAKLGIFLDGIMFAMAMADQSNEIRKQRDRSQERERELLEQDLEAQKKINLLENQFQSALSLAQQKSYTLASAGHDLRQPIVALKSAMNFVTQRDDVDPKTVDQFRQGFDYIEKLIKEYLDFPDEVKNSPSKPSGLRQDPNGVYHDNHVFIETTTEVFAVDILLKNINSMFQADATKKNLTLRCRMSTAIIKANPVSVMRIVSNLVENAIKYTDEGKILVGCRRRKNAIEIQVWDTGVGFSDEQKEKFFEAYARDTSSKADGQGLGLSIVKKLAEENNYILVLNSRIGKGSAFKILIPRVDV